MPAEQERRRLAPPEISETAARLHRICEAMARDHYVGKPVSFVIGNQDGAYAGARDLPLPDPAPPRSRSPAEFTGSLVEDRVNGEASYVEFLSSVHKAVMAQLDK